MIDGGRPLHILDQILDQYGRSECSIPVGCHGNVTVVVENW